MRKPSICNACKDLAEKEHYIGRMGVIDCIAIDYRGLLVELVLPSFWALRFIGTCHSDEMLRISTDG